MLEGAKLEAEIAQIERELKILRGRYGLMERWAKGGHRDRHFAPG